MLFIYYKGALFLFILSLIILNNFELLRWSLTSNIGDIIICGEEPWVKDLAIDWSVLTYHTRFINMTGRYFDLCHLRWISVIWLSSNVTASIKSAIAVSYPVVAIQDSLWSQTGGFIFLEKVSYMRYVIFVIASISWKTVRNNRTIRTSV